MKKVTVSLFAIAITALSYGQQPNLKDLSQETDHYTTLSKSYDLTAQQRTLLKAYFNLDTISTQKGLKVDAITAKKDVLHEQLSQLLPDAVMTTFNALIDPDSRALTPLKKGKNL